MAFYLRSVDTGLCWLHDAGHEVVVHIARVAVHLLQGEDGKQSTSLHRSKQHRLLTRCVRWWTIGRPQPDGI